jgi:polyphosphate kinase 2 (PPK2 family)
VKKNKEKKRAREDALAENGAGDIAAAGPPEKLERKDYEKELRRLQAELCRLQDWVKQSGERAVVAFEGRDAAGKGGTIKAISGA